MFTIDLCVCGLWGGIVLSHKTLSLEEEEFVG